MSTFVGSNAASNGLIFVVDVANKKSNFNKYRDNNVLPDPYSTWSTGSGGSTGYGANGATTEQNRYVTSTDPWGGRSIVWECVPDATSGADGGWNSSYYTVDTSYTHRWSVWVRKTANVSNGTVYLGLNPAPIRIDNGASQGNPYFYYIGTGSITQNEWQLWVGHCFPYGYTGTGPHKDTGRWRQDGSYIGGLSGNVGSQDVKFPSVTGSFNHRAYLYYCTDITQRVEFANPRLDRCDGQEPSLYELITNGPSIWTNQANPQTGSIQNGQPIYTTLGGAECFRFNGLNMYFDDQNTLTDVPSQYLTIEAWIYPEAEVSSGDRGTIVRIHDGQSAYMSWNKTTQQLSTYWYSHTPAGYHELGPAMARNQWHHVCAVWDGTTHYHYIDGVQYSTSVTGNAATGNYVEIGMESTGRQFSGGISMVRIYNTALTADQVLTNFNGTRVRYGL